MRHKLIYDPWNRLVKVTDTSDTTVAQYVYDGLHRRVQRKLYVGGSLDRTLDDYYNASWQLLEVREDGETNPLKQFVWGENYIDAPVVRWRDTDLDGTVDETLYYTYDGNQNVTGVFNASTEAVERYDYDPYGNRIVLNGENDADGAVSDWSVDADGISDVDNRIAFAGYRLDVESGLYHVRYRMYHPTLGRWTQRDPLGYVDGMNVYEYVGGRATRWSDPAGLASVGIYDDDKDSEFEEAADDYDYTIDASSPDEAARKLQELQESIRDSGEESIDEAHIFDHGWNGYQELGEGHLRPGDQSLRDIGGTLGPDGALCLHGCRVAGGDEGKQFLQDLADTAGIPVSGSENDVWYFGDAVGGIPFPFLNDYWETDTITAYPGGDCANGNPSSPAPGDGKKKKKKKKK